MWNELLKELDPAITTELAKAIKTVVKEALTVGTELACDWLKQAQQPKKPVEDVILELLQTPQHIDELHVKSHIGIPQLHAVLLQMEFAGKIQQRPGKIFARA